jgi:ribosomal-protein-alanine acetyltransferase
VSTVIVHAGWTDALLLSAMHAECFEAVWSKQAVFILLQQPGVFALIAHSGDQPAGFCLSRVAADECEILSCGVVPAFRRQRIGHAMMSHVFAEAAARGAVEVFLEVAESNHAARHLYARMGLHQVGRRCAYYRRSAAAPEDALVLRGKP